MHVGTRRAMLTLALVDAASHHCITATTAQPLPLAQQCHSPCHVYRKLLTCFARPVAPLRPKSIAPVSVTYASRRDCHGRITGKLRKFELLDSESPKRNIVQRSCVGRRFQPVREPVQLAVDAEQRCGFALHVAIHECVQQCAYTATAVA